MAERNFKKFLDDDEQNEVKRKEMHMKEIIETIILNLVDNKDAVSVNEVQGEKSIVYEVKVAEDDMGKVIGRQGRLAKYIRTVVKSIGAREHKKVSVEFID